jgi:CheY-like chemotaxis protein
LAGGTLPHARHPYEDGLAKGDAKCDKSSVIHQMSHHHSIRRHEAPKPEKVYEITDTGESVSHPNILILEDDVALAQQLKEALETEGYSVTVASNGADGLKKILAADFNLILCDMVMPNFPGDMFYLAVERARPQLCKRFIFMTGHQDDRKIEQFIQRIQGLMLWKPFPMNALFDAISVVNNKK